MVVLIILVLAAAFLAYLYQDYKRVQKAARRIHSLPDQTGEFTVGRKDKPIFNMLILGDSIAAATGIKNFDQSLGGILANKIAEDHYVLLSNRAAKGNWISDVAIEKITGHWNLILIITGANEIVYNIGLKSFHRYLHKVIKTLKPATRTFVLAGPGKVTAARTLPLWLRLFLSGKQARVAKTMKNVASRNGIVYINPLDYEIKPGYWAADKLHPNAEGHRAWFEMIWANIESEIK